MNTCSFIGRIANEPEMFATPNPNVPGLKFSICINSRYRKDGQWVDEPNFFNINMFGKRAAGLFHSGHLQKGKKVSLQAEARQKRWIAKDGSKHQSIGFVANDLQFC